MRARETLRKKQTDSHRSAAINPHAIAEPSLTLSSRQQTVLNMQQSRGNAAVLRWLAQPQPATSARVQRMIPCPPRLGDNEPTPPGWKPYYGNSSVFHCGFRGILEDRRPTPDDPENECFYDHTGALVDASHPYAGCAGTPDQYDSEHDKLRHTFLDDGGILWSGPRALAESIGHGIDELIDGTAPGDVPVHPDAGTTEQPEGGAPEPPDAGVPEPVGASDDESA